MTLKELITKYDSPDKKGFYNHDYIGELKNITEEDHTKSEYTYEGIIHSLMIHPDGCHWGTYLGYMFSGTDEYGATTEFPSKEDVTAEVVTYSETRMRQTRNPKMQMQYAAVCWDFMSMVGLARPSDLHELYLDSLIATIRGDYEPHPVITAKHIRRAFSLVGKSTLRINELKAVLRDYTIIHGVNDTAAGIWGVEFDLMLRNKNSFSAEEKGIIVKEHEDRLSRLASNVAKLDPFAVQEQVSLLADYYKSVSKTDDIQRVLHVLEDVIRETNTGKAALQRMGMFQILSSVYNSYGLRNDANRLLPEIQQISSESPSEMEETHVEYTLTQEQIDFVKRFIADHLEGTDQEKFMKYVYYHVERKKHVTRQVHNNAIHSPLWAMTSTQMMDEKGRPMSLLRSVEDDLEGHVAYTASQNMLLSANILHQITQKHIDTGFFSISSILNEVKESAIIDASRYDIIEHALGFFFSKDYVTFCHLIVPQIEDALRNIVERSGNAVIRRQQSGFGYQIKTLDDILLDSSIAYTMTEDGVFHLRTLLTDQKGMNIRNLLCHGISNPNCFNIVAAERLLHALLMIAFVRYQK